MGTTNTCPSCGEPMCGPIQSSAEGTCWAEDRWCRCERDAARRMWPRFSAAFIRMLRGLGKLRKREAQQ